MTNSIKVSIIIPVFNAEKWIQETLLSIQDQTYQNWECILVDDGSTDRSKHIISEFSSKDPRFKLFSRDREPKGAPTCRNIGLQKSSGEFINWFDSDDLMHPEMIERKLKFFESHPKADFCVSRCSTFFENPANTQPLNYILSSKNQVADYFSFKLRFYTPGPMFRRGFLEQLGQAFNEQLIRHQEGEFFFRVLINSTEYGQIEEPLIFIRKHDNSLGSSYSKKRSKEFDENEFLLDKLFLDSGFSSPSVIQNNFDPFHQLSLRFLKKGVKLNRKSFGMALKYYFRLLQQAPDFMIRLSAILKLPLRLVNYRIR